MTCNYSIEVIPQQSQLFRRFPPWQYNRTTGNVIAEVFQDTNCSVDWDRYSTPQETLCRFKKDSDWGVIKIQAEYARSVEGQQVLHKPSHKHQAHSEIIGEKIMKIRDDLVAGSTIAIYPSLY